MKLPARGAGERGVEMATLEKSKYLVDEVVTFRPRVTGGHVVAVVTETHHHPLMGWSYTIRVTDGTMIWPTGSTECVREEILD